MKLYKLHPLIHKSLRNHSHQMFQYRCQYRLLMLSLCSDNQKRFASRCRENKVWHFVVHSPQEAVQAVAIVSDALSYGAYQIIAPAASQEPLDENLQGGGK